MDEIDVGVGLQQVAPHALALMRLARHQQHAQLVAHAFDRDDRLAVAVGDLVLHRRDFELDDIRAGVVDRRLDLEVLPDFGVQRRDRLAVAAHRHRRRLALIVGIDDARDDRLVLADDAEARRLDELDAPVALALVAGDEHMHRRVEAERARRGRDVVGVSVGEQHRAADPLRRRIGQRRAQRGEQLRAAVVEVARAASSTSRTSTLSSAARRFSSSARAAAVCFGRSSIWFDSDWSTTTATTSFSGRRSSCTNDGSASAASSSAQANARGSAAPGRRQTVSATIASAATASAIIAQDGIGGAEGDRPRVQCDSLSKRSFAWTWSAL